MSGNQFQARYDGLMGLSRHEGMDIKPTLLRVLTDLYVQAPRHTPEERASFTELTLRLVGSVDPATHQAVAEKLRAHPDTPDAVRVALGLTPAETPADIAQDSTADPPIETIPIVEHAEPHVIAEPATEPEPVWMPAPASLAPPPIATNAAEAEARSDDQAALTDRFFAATPAERADILAELATCEAPAPALPPIDGGYVAVFNLERAVLSKDRAAAVLYLGKILALPPALARRIVDDPSGEPFLVCARMLAMPIEVLQRCLMFINTAVGHSPLNVFRLSALYPEITPLAAAAMVASWQGKRIARPRPRHQTMAETTEVRHRAVEARPAEPHRGEILPRRAEPSRAG